MWVVAAALTFTLETGSKREIRVAQAQADTQTRRWHLAETYWLARAELRRALVARTLAQASIGLAEQELALRQEFVDWVGTQIRFGLGIGADRLTAETNLSRAQSQLRGARGDLVAAEAQIAAATGVAIENLPLSVLAPIAFDTLPAPNSADTAGLRDWGIVNRLTVRHGLADYAVAEQALRQAVAQQYPDVNLGPGYSYDRGDHAITLTSSAVIPLLHDQSAAIAQAEDTRAKAAVQFQALQAQALAEIDSATARYQTAYTALADTRMIEELARQTVTDVQRRVTAGAADRGEILTAQIGLATAERASLDALRAATDALGALEDGVQRPVWPASALGIARPDMTSLE